MFIWESKKNPVQGAREGIITMHLLDWVVLPKLMLFLCYCHRFFFSFVCLWFMFLFLQCDGCDKRGVISLILDHGNPPREHHCREVGLMLFNCDGLIPVTFSFNGGWLAVMVYHCHHNFIIFFVINLSSSH